LIPWGGLRCLKEARLQLDGRPDRLTQGTEHREGFVSPQLDHGSVPSLDVLSNDLGEPCRQPGGRLIAALQGEHGISTNVRDEEGSDLRGRFVRSRNVFGVAHPLRSLGSLTALPHAAEYRPWASRPPDSGVVLSLGHGLQPRVGRLRTAGRGFSSRSQAASGNLGTVVPMRAEAEREEPE
jgi:hypothetical protein